MFKKIASLAIAATMMVGTAAITASAAEVESDAVGAEDSAVVSADNSSEVGADAGSEAVGAGNVIKFDAKKSGWNLDTNKKFFCHIWKADGSKTSEGKDWPAWQSKAELCTLDKDTGIATYDLSKADPGISSSDGSVYCVIFSSNTGMQTYNTIMSGACIGDTLYCNGEQIENPEDSEKKAMVAVWENNPTGGPEKKITSTGNIVGTAFPDGESDVTLVANYLMQYYEDPAKTDLTQNILDTLKVSPTDVIAVVKKRADGDDKKINAIVDILSKCTDPTTGKKVDKETLEKTQAGASGASSTGSGSNGGSTGSGSNSGSSSVKSGVETTIFYVFGGLMLAAAGVAFLARKKREE